ncbi:hypothetical protein JCM10213_001447 [Rhodosporidiobolus nylandii]
MKCLKSLLRNRCRQPATSSTRRHTPRPPTPPQPRPRIDAFADSLFGRLPPELVERVFELLPPPRWALQRDAGRQQSLLACCLVCRLFRDIAQPLLWRDVDCNMAHRARLEEHLLSGEERGRVQTLRANARPDFQWSTLSRLTNLRTLELVLVDLHNSPLISELPVLEELVLTRIPRFSPSLFQNTHLPSLDTLVLRQLRPLPLFFRSLLPQLDLILLDLEHFRFAHDLSGNPSLSSLSVLADGEDRNIADLLSLAPPRILYSLHPYRPPEDLKQCRRDLPHLIHLVRQLPSLRSLHLPRFFRVTPYLRRGVALLAEACKNRRVEIVWYREEASEIERARATRRALLRLKDKEKQVEV